jgi:hypothetical protein
MDRDSEADSFDLTAIVQGYISTHAPFADPRLEQTRLHLLRVFAFGAVVVRDRGYGLLQCIEGGMGAVLVAAEARLAAGDVPEDRRNALMRAVDAERAPFVALGPDKGLPLLLAYAIWKLYPDGTQLEDVGRQVIAAVQALDDTARERARSVLVAATERSWANWLRLN